MRLNKREGHMKQRDYSKFVDIFIVSMNFVLIRVDAFLQNAVNFLAYSLYQTVFLSLLDNLLTISLTKILLISLGVHFLYSITYMLNDFINYYDDRSLSYDRNKYSFYKLRLIQFLGRRLEGFIIQASYYTIIFCTLLYLLRERHTMVYSIVLIVLAFIILSIIESLSKKKTLTKHLSLVLQQITKVLAFSYMLNAIYLGVYDELALIAFLSWGLVFIGYATLRGVFEHVCHDCSLGEGNLMKDIPLSLLYLFYRRPFIALLTLSPYFLIIILYIYLAGLIGQSLKILVATGISHLMLTPIWLFYLILTKILGEKDKDLYQLLMRLILKFIFLLVYSLIFSETLSSIPLSM